MIRFPHVRQFVSLPHLRYTFKRRLAFITVLLLFGFGAAVWQSSSAAVLNSEQAGMLLRVRRAFGLATPLQGGIGSRTIISTIAGGGFSNNTLPREAPMMQPTATALDPLGRGFYVVDEVGGSSLLRFVNTSANSVTLAGVTIPAGQIGLVAGGGPAPEFGSARESDLSLVTGIVVDPSGNVVYLSTPLVNSIRAINVGTQNFTIFGRTIAPGTIGLLFQTSRPEVRALTMNPQTRDFFYVSTLAGNLTTRVIWRLDATSGQESVYAGGGDPSRGNGDGGAATDAKIVSPLGLAVDPSGNLLIAEGGDVRNNPGAVRKVDAGGTITSVATQLEFPTGLTVTSSGTIYVALGNKQQFVRVSSGGQVTAVVGDNSAVVCNQVSNPTCGDGGLALSANLNLPSSTDQRNLPFAADANGIFIPDSSFRHVRYANLSNGSITILGLTIGARQINSIVGNGQEPPYDNIPATSSELQGPTGVAADAQGNLYIADTNPDPISHLRFVNRGATPVTLFANTAWAKTVQPGQIVTLNDGVTISRTDDRISTASFESPQALFTVANGVYIVDSQYGALIKPPQVISGRRSGHIRFLNTSNADVTLFGGSQSSKVIVPPGQVKDLVGVNEVAPNSGYGLNGNIGDGGAANAAVIFPTDVWVDAQSNIYIADQGSNRIRVVNGSNGVINSIQGSVGSDGGGSPLTTNGATGVALDNQGRLLIADTKANRVLRQSAPNSNNFVTIADQTKGINRPRDVISDATGNVFVTNSGSQQIMRIVAPTNALGTTSIVAGTGIRGFGGDGGPGNRAKMDLPNPTGNFDIQYTVSLATLPDGNFVFTDTNNNRVRMLVQVPNQTPQLAAINNETINEGQTRALTFSATDGNNDPLTFTVNNKPNFATLTDNGNGTASLQLAPGFADAGAYQVSVSVSDGDATDTKNFTITVVDVNRPPTVTVQPIASPLEATSTAGRQVTLTATGSDPDNDQITYKWFDGAAQIATTATATVTLGFGQHAIFVTVTDAKDARANSSTVNILVQDTTPPVFANIPADITTAPTSASGANVNFALPTATDAVDGPVTVTASPVSGSLFPLGTTTVNFTARDSRNNIGRASFKITVTTNGGGGGGGGGGGTGTDFTITTIAGNGNYGYSGDGSAATEATFKEIKTVSRDKDGNLLIADGQGRVVRRVNLQSAPQGQIRTVAGNGSNGNTGDGGLGIHASFGAVSSAVSDAQGNLYMADANFHRVRKITTDGRIAHFAGSSQGISGSQGDFGTAASARLTRPAALAMDAQGNVYIADSGNHRIRRVDVNSNIITTYAGNGGAGFNGDGGPATSASLNNPTGLAFDAQGNLFIVDRNNQRIRRVDAATKVISTIAGSGTQGSAGDDGAATSAQLNNPTDVVVDAQGNVLITDYGNHRIRRVSNQTIKTIAGTGLQGFSGDSGPALQARLNTPAGIAVDAQGNVYFGDAGNLRVRRLSGGSGGSGGGTTNRAPVITSTITNQSLTRGQTVELPLSANDEDGDSVAFTLSGAPSFASITNANPAQRTATLHLAPTEAGTFNNIQVQATDGKGGTAMSAAFNVTVNEPSANNRPPTASANTLPATVEATSRNGAQVTLNSSGNDLDGDPLTFTWSDGNAAIATGANTTATLALGTHSIKLTVADNRGGQTTTTSQTVVVQDTTSPVFGNVPSDINAQATSGSGANVTFNLPTATDAVDGNVAVTAEPPSGSLFPVGTTTVNFTARDTRNNTGRASFRVTVTAGGTGGGGTTSFAISTYAGNGSYGFSGDGGPAVDATLRSITALNHDKDGNLLIVDGQSRNVRRVNAQGVISTVAGNGANANSGDNGTAIYASFGAPGGVAADAQGNLYVSDSSFHRVRKIAPDGRIAHFAGSLTGVGGAVGDNGTATSARLSRPGALAVDAQGNLFILDAGNHRVRRVDVATNIITNYAGIGAGFSGDGGPATIASLNNPTGIAIDAQGNLFIADRGNQRIRRVDAVTKIITTVAGSGVQGFSGEEGSATDAQLNNPSDVSVDGNGNLFIADQSNQRLRRVDGSSRVIKTLAGSSIASFEGDGGPAAQARLNLPSSVDVAANGSVFVGDAGNLRVRKLTPAGPAPQPNRLPVISSALGNQELTKGQTLDLPLSASDEDGDSVSFTLTGAPAFASIINANPAQRTATLRLAPTETGTFNNVQVQATDSKGGKATSAAFSIKVNDVSSCIANVPADRWKGEYFANRLLQSTPAMVRDDGAGNLNFNFGADSPSAACNVPVDNFSIRWTRTANFDTAGLYRFSVTGDDGVRLYVDDTLRLDQWKDQSEANFTVDVQLNAGPHTLRFEQYDSGILAVARLSWTLAGASSNRAPAIEFIQNQTVTRGQVIEVEVRATDADGDVVTFTLENAPAFVTLTQANPQQRTATLRIAPSAGDAVTIYTLKVNADDGRGGKSASNSVTVTIADNSNNRPPIAVANRLPDTALAGENGLATVQLDGSASTDPDGDQLTFAWLDRGTVIATSATVTVKLPVGEHLIALRVSDGRGGSNTTSLQKLVVSQEAPPRLSINSLSPSSGKRGTTVAAVISGSGFTRDTQVQFSGAGITVFVTYLNENQLNLRLLISNNALSTVRSVIVTNPGAETVTKANAFAVTP